MSTLLAGLLFLLAPETPVQHEYAGQLVQDVRGGEDIVAKRFTLTCLTKSASDENDNTLEVGYLLDENGGGGWPWIDTFGVERVDLKTAPQTFSGPELLHTFGEVNYPLPVRLPVVVLPEKPEVGAEWEAEGLAWTITGAKTQAGHACFEVEAIDRRGLVEKLRVDQATAVVVRSARSVVMGRGDRFTLTQELKTESAPTPEVAEKFGALLTSLVALRSELGRTKRSERGTLTEAGLKTLSERLPELLTSAEGTSFSDLLLTAKNDLETQTAREQGLGDLQSAFVGKAAPKVDLITLKGEPLDAGIGDGSLVLLHFWGYRDEPLKEPYGQVGYLDFLQNQAKRRKYDLQVIGVAVDPRFGDAESAGAAARSAGRTREFFRLGYPIARDDGAVLKAFGDPQRSGNSLPLWVLIDGDGVVQHYFSGLHEVDPKRGLVALEAEVVKLVKARRAAGAQDSKESGE